MKRKVLYAKQEQRNIDILDISQEITSALIQPNSPCNISQDSYQTKQKDFDDYCNNALSIRSL
jgi:hypothetical protein